MIQQDQKDKLRTDALFKLLSKLFDYLKIKYHPSILKKNIIREYDVFFKLNADAPYNFDTYYVIADEMDDPINLFPIIRNTLNKYRIKTELIEAKSLESRPLPFIGLLRKKNEDVLSAECLALISKNEFGELKYYFTQDQSTHDSSDYFNERYMGLGLMVERKTQTREPDYNLNHKKFLLNRLFKGVTFITIIFFGTIAIEQGISTYTHWIDWLPLIILKVIGVIVCINLHKLELSASYSSDILKKFCTIDEQFSCEKVVSSEASKIFGIISMSDIGLVYFFGGLVSLLLGLATLQLQAALPFLFLLTLSSLPYTFFSIYYQARVIKYYCMMCLTVQGLLWLEFITYCFLVNPKLWPLSFGGLVLLALVFVLVITLFKFYKEQTAIKFESAKNDGILTNLRRNPYVLKGLLESSPIIDTTQLPGEIVFGQEGNPIPIILVLDPRCPHCAKTYPMWQELVDWHPNRFYIRIRLLASPIYVPILKDILHLTLDGKMQEAKDRLGHWYEYRLSQTEKGNEDFNERFFRLRKQWVSKYKIETNVTAILDVIYNKYVDWHGTFKILSFPALFVHGHFMPMYYDKFEMLKYFVEELPEILSHPDS